MAGLVPAIHVPAMRKKDVDAATSAGMTSDKQYALTRYEPECLFV
jgi:hypothetical protein